MDVPQHPLNRTILELKWVSAESSTSQTGDSQSYHTGIEILDCRFRQYKFAPLNRTILELKYAIFGAFSEIEKALNRTILELK